MRRRALSSASSSPAPSMPCSKTGPGGSWPIDGDMQRMPMAMTSSAACCRLSATWAAMTRCRSAIRLHLAHRQSLYLQWRLWPLSHETMPWLRQRAHFGLRTPRSASVSSEDDTGDEAEDIICCCCCCSCGCWRW